MEYNQSCMQFVAFALLIIYGIFIDPKIEKAKKAEAVTEAAADGAENNE